MILHEPFARRRKRHREWLCEGHIGHSVVWGAVLLQGAARREEPLANRAAAAVGTLAVVSGSRASDLPGADSFNDTFPMAVGPQLLTINKRTRHG